MEQNLAVNLDPDNITLGDIEDMETHFGIKLGDFQKVFRPGAQVDTDSLDIKMLCAIVFLVKRVGDPDFDPKAVRRMRMSDLKGFLGDEAEAVANVHPNPTQGE